MDNIDNILQQLRDYSVPPPVRLYDEVKERIMLDEEVVADAYRRFAVLAQYETEPPAGSFEKVMGRIAGNEATEQRGGKVLGMGRRYWMVAAGILLLLSCWAVYSIVSGNKKDQPDPIAGKPVPVEQPSQVKDKEKEQADTVQQNNLIRQEPDRHIAGNQRVYRPRNQYNSSFTVGDQEFRSMDNDLLATFASYTAKEVPGFMTDESDEAVLIKIDQYSSLTLSGKARQMMRTMYDVRRNGKPTRKAKKMTKKVEQWKKADQSRFDKNFDRNPLDPVDLGDFIFK